MSMTIKIGHEIKPGNILKFDCYYIVLKLEFIVVDNGPGMVVTCLSNTNIVHKFILSENNYYTIL